MELHSGPNVNGNLCLSPLPFFLHFPLPPPFRHFTSVKAQDPGGLRNGPRVWHRWRTLTSCRTRCRASCRQELFPPQVTYTDLLPRPCPFSQQPAAHPLNGTLQNLTALIQSTSQNHWLSRPTPLPSQQAPPCNHSFRINWSGELFSSRLL